MFLIRKALISSSSGRSFIIMINVVFCCRVSVVLKSTDVCLLIFAGISHQNDQIFAIRSRNGVIVVVMRIESSEHPDAHARASN